MSIVLDGVPVAPGEDEAVPINDVATGGEWCGNVATWTGG